MESGLHFAYLGEIPLWSRYNFLYTENNSISQEEFGDFLLIILDNLLKQENINILDDSEIDTISGGTNKFFSKTMAVILGTLSIYTGNISNQNIQAISNTKTSNSMSISEVQDKIGNLSKEEIEKIQKDLKKEIKKHGLEKYLKIHKSKDKNWQYVFNKDGENTITLLTCLSEKATTLDSTIDGYKITRVSDSFGHIKEQFLLKETLKPYLFAGALACTIILIPFIGFMYDSGDPFGKKYESIFSNIKSVNLEYCTHISNNSFKNCANLEQVNLPMCEEIGESAFYDCTNLNKINLPNCKIIKDSAFRNCINLTNVELPMCQEIDSATFYNCTKLNKINLPNCKIIKEYAFRDCTNLTDIESPMCQEIGIFTFYSCTKLNNINLPNCKSIDNTAFNNCVNLGQNRTEGKEKQKEK